MSPKQPPKQSQQSPQPPPQQLPMSVNISPTPLTTASIGTFPPVAAMSPKASAAVAPPAVGNGAWLSTCVPCSDHVRSRTLHRYSAQPIPQTLHRHWCAPRRGQVAGRQGKRICTADTEHVKPVDGHARQTSKAKPRSPRMAIPPTANFAGDTRRRALRAALKSAIPAVVVRKPTIDVCAHGTPSAQLSSMTCADKGCVHERKRPIGWTCNWQR